MGTVGEYLTKEKLQEICKGINTNIFTQDDAPSDVEHYYSHTHDMFPIGHILQHMEMIYTPLNIHPAYMLGLYMGLIIGRSEKEIEILNNLIVDG